MALPVPYRAPVIIGGREFRTKAEAERFIREILGRYGNECDSRFCDRLYAISREDRKFVEALLDLHPNKGVIVGEGIREISVQHLHDRYNSRRFIVVRRDSSYRDFTWRHALYPRDARKNVMRLCRLTVRHQTQAFRDRFFNSTRNPCCSLTGQPLTYENSDVDHIHPDEFECLVDRWLASVHLVWSDIGIIPSPDYEKPDRFEDIYLAQSWAEFHDRHARLRVIHREAHQRLPKGKH